jgi:predicted PurR-regulated permease PerM
MSDRLPATHPPARPHGGASTPSSVSPAPSASPSASRHPGRKPGWRTADIARAAAISVAIVAAAVGLWAASTIVFTVFLGVLFGVAISRGVDFLARAHVPRGVGAVGIVLGVAAILALLGALMAPTLSEQTRQIQSRLPDALRQAESVGDRLRHTLGTITGRTPAVAPSPDSNRARRGDSSTVAQGVGGGTPTAGPGVQSQVSQHLGGLVGGIFSFVGSTVEIIVYLLLILFLAVYIGTNPGLYQRGLMHLFPHRARERAGEVLSRIATIMRKWLLTQLIAMITLGVVWAIVLSVLQVKAALALAVIAGVLEFVPTIGPTMAVVPALAMALLDSPTKALTVLAAYLVIQGLESNLLIPLLMQGRIDLPPALTITFQALMALAFGFLGLLVAVPLLAVIMVPIKLLYVEDVVGDPVSEEGEDTG